MKLSHILLPLALAGCGLDVNDDGYTDTARLEYKVGVSLRLGYESRGRPRHTGPRSIPVPGIIHFYFKNIDTTRGMDLVATVVPPYGPEIPSKVVLYQNDDGTFKAPVPFD